MEPSDHKEESSDEVVAPAEIDLLELPSLPTGHFPKEVRQNMRRTRDLMKANKMARGCAQALLDAYQLQQWAAYAMSRINVDERSGSILLEYVKLKAMMPFQETSMRDSIRDRSLPFISDRILEHMNQRIQERKQE